ncbi:MAG: hypothetical protein ACOC6H_04245 [Thermoproteota archaeon]
MTRLTGVEFILPGGIPENRVGGRFRKDAGLTREIGVENSSPLTSGEDYMGHVQCNLRLDHHTFILDETNI